MKLLSVPIGTIIDYAGASTPEGYLECDGTERDVAAYPALASVLGSTWGAPSSSAKFKLPDLRGRVGIGAGTGTAGGATAHALGSSGGDERLQSHTHTLKKNVPYGIPYNDNSGSRSGNTGTGPLYGESYTPFTIESAGGGSSQNMQPYATVRKLIRAA